MRLLSSLLLLFFAVLPAQAQFAGTNTTVRLLFSATAVKPGEEFTAALQFKMNAGWHTYWTNAGESGKPIEVEWKLPAGFEAGPMQWQAPEKIDTEGIITYGYHDEATLLVPIRVTAGAAQGKHSITAALNWLECKELCLPAETNLSESIEIGSSTVASAHTTLIENAREAIPKTGATLKLITQWVGAPQGEKQDFWIEFSPPNTNGVWDFFPYASEEMEIAGATKVEPSSDGKVRLRKTAIRLGKVWSTRLEGVLVRTQGDAHPVEAHEVRATIQRAGLELSAGGLAPLRNDQEPRSLWAMLVFAFIGGLILNIMPCVLPVISLKILGFVQQSAAEPGRVRTLGFIYGVGVLASFMLLAGIIIAVKAAGGNAIWGMQFQNPIFIVTLITLVVLVALNLFGVFEINLGGGAINSAGALASKEGGVGAFFNGVLTTVLATPCSAPFLGLALGFAFTQRPAIILLVFAFIAFGLAFPYVLLTSNPQWLRFLPKPGMWMIRFKQLMGFPMLATAFWLMGTALAHFGGESIFILGLFLVAVAVSAWIWGEFAQRGSRPMLGRIIAVVIFASAYLFLLERELHWRSPLAAESSSPERVSNDPTAIRWEPWTHEAVAKARQEGRPIFVDFTAIWCPQCQANKRFAINVPTVRAKMKELNVLALKADITTRAKDPVISEELEKHGRAAIPLNLIYPDDPSRPPEVLPELLTPTLVLNALDRAVTKQSPKTASAQKK